MQGDQLGAGDGTELVHQQLAAVLVHAQRLGDIAARAQYFDERDPRGLPERGGVDGGRPGPLGARKRSPSLTCAGARHDLEGLDPGLREVAASLLDPARLEAGQQARAGNGRHRLGGRRCRVQIAAGVRLLGGGESLVGRFPVDPGVIRDQQLQVGAPVDGVGPEDLAQAREVGRQEPLGAGGRGAVGPERLDELVAADDAPAVQHEEGEQQAALPAA